MNKSIGIVSLGCAKNLVDTEIMLGILLQRGYKIVNNYEKADIAIINTCGFIEEAKEESLEAIVEAVKLKNSGKIEKIIVVGCFSERYKNQLEREFPEVDIFLGVNEYPKIREAVEGEEIKLMEDLYLPKHTYPRLLTTPSSWAYLKVSEGCSHKCSFCAIPLIRGPYRSRPIASVLQEARNLLSTGVKEIILISQDTTYYGRDINLKNGLITLLKELIELKDLKWVRFLYCVPEEITDSLLEIMQEDKICSYLDIPFQHANEKIIKRMKRKFNGKEALNLIEKIRKKVQDVALRTSLIVGFPGEGEREFEELKQFCKEAKFDHLGVFKYSREEGTSAYKLGDPVPENTKEKRQREIMELQAEISYEINKKLIGKKEEVIIEGESKEDSNILIGRMKRQAPEVDGVVFIEKNNVSKLNEFIVKVEIMEAFAYDLKGRLIS